MRLSEINHGYKRIYDDLTDKSYIFQRIKSGGVEYFECSVYFTFKFATFVETISIKFKFQTQLGSCKTLQ